MLFRSAVLEETSTSAASTFSYNDPVKSEPSSGRATSAPVAHSDSPSNLDTLSPLPFENLSGRVHATPVVGSATIQNSSGNNSSSHTPSSPPPVPSPTPMTGATSTVSSQSSQISGRTSGSQNADCAVPGFQVVSSHSSPWSVWWFVVHPPILIRGLSFHQISRGEQIT